MWLLLFVYVCLFVIYVFKRNFYVWNEVWMVCGDLGISYYGWQVIDVMLQEFSGGKVN